MRKLLFLFLFLPFLGWGQNSWCDYQYTISFDDSDCLSALTIDSTNSIWQIGKPQKTSFNSAFSNPNVIVTDTLNTYPINDTSFFVIRHIAAGGVWGGTPVIIEGQYWVDTDSLHDYGKIELSTDSLVWYDLLNDSLSITDSSRNTPPILTGKTNGWQPFSFYFNYIWNGLGVFPGDTIYFRFSFISDSIDGALDGLMFDSLHFIDATLSIEEFDFINSTISPNPTTQNLKIQFPNPNQKPFELSIFDNLGKLIYRREDIADSQLQLDVSAYPSGIYHYQLLKPQSREKSFGKFVKQ